MGIYSLLKRMNFTSRSSLPLGLDFFNFLNLLSFKTLYLFFKKLIYQKPVRLWELEPKELQSFY